MSSAREAESSQNSSLQVLHGPNNDVGTSEELGPEASILNISEIAMPLATSTQDKPNCHDISSQPRNDSCRKMLPLFLESIDSPSAHICLSSDSKEQSLCANNLDVMIDSRFSSPTLIDSMQGESPLSNDLDEQIDVSLFSSYAGTQ
ncbi:hypothetical protein Ciccas_000255 [Cichlidogyrus casuarinus]|uniref:Uncharacterized protein n=1 Tax=Cichlidogyrus casuarinus TaxID=1844966 RepID=A0ABD2QND6_9PLAT